ncbi:MAG TPA: serine/threonine-protein kinase, partial [Kofleriaceae bacterium]
MEDDLDLLTEIDPQINLPVDVDDVPFGDEVERFHQIGMLGKGGMGEVRLVRDTRIARFVAFKVLRSARRKDPEYRSRFIIEARVQGQLEHPAIVPVHDLGETLEGELFFSMKCVRGMTLRQALAATRDRKYSRRRLLAAFSSVCLAIDFAHSRGVVHRDLKPENVMLGDFGEVYVLDWGIAKVMDRVDTASGDETVDVPGDTETRAGTVMGTPKYMAPERKTGLADPRTDVFALGVTLGEILANESEVDVPPELTAIVARATAGDPSQRFSSARSLNEAVEQFLDGDRDLEARTKLAEEHARRAEEAVLRVDPSGRIDAGREIGRALGLDPTNARALRALMGLLTDVPERLPPAAQAEIDLRWRERRQRTLRIGTVSTLSVLALVPLIIGMGVLDWGLLAAFVTLMISASACQYVAARTADTLPFAGALVLLMAALAVLETSMGLLGVVPLSFAVVTIAWRMNVERALHGVLILVTATAALLAPFVLTALGIMSPIYSVHDGVIVLLPKMHAFPPAATIALLIASTFGGIAIALLYGRLYVNELRRAE